MHNANTNPIPDSNLNSNPNYESTKFHKVKYLKK